jgi:hypothetical protein
MQAGGRGRAAAAAQRRAGAQGQHPSLLPHPPGARPRPASDERKALASGQQRAVREFDTGRGGEWEREKGNERAAAMAEAV